MTPTERAKRSDALYYETVSVTRRVLCDMIANREADLEDAKAENEELWDSNERMGLKYMAAMGEVQEENERIRAENAKLRELVEDMLDCIQIRAAFGRPPTEEMYEMFYKRARELGVDE